MNTKADMLSRKRSSEHYRRQQGYSITQGRNIDKEYYNNGGKNSLKELSGRKNYTSRRNIKK